MTDISHELMDEIYARIEPYIRNFMQKQPDHTIWHLTHHEPGRFELDYLVSTSWRPHNDDSPQKMAARLVCAYVQQCVREDLTPDPDNFGLRSTMNPSNIYNPD